MEKTNQIQIFSSGSAVDTGATYGGESIDAIRKSAYLLQQEINTAVQAFRKSYPSCDIIVVHKSELVDTSGLGADDEYEVKTMIPISNEWLKKG